MPLRDHQTSGTMTQSAPGALAAAGAVPLLYALLIEGPTGGQNFILPNFQTRVVDVWFVKTGGNGGAGDTAQLQTAGGAANVTDALDLNVTDGAIVRAATINDAAHTFAAGATMHVANNEALLVDGIMYVRMARA